MKPQTTLSPLDQNPVQDPPMVDREKHCDEDEFCQEVRTALSVPEATRKDIQLNMYH